MQKMTADQTCQKQFLDKSSAQHEIRSFFSIYILLSLQNVFNLLYNISKIALPRYSHVSYKKWNGWAEDGHWLATNFTAPAVMWKNIFWSFSIPFGCNKHLLGQSANIHCFAFFAVLPVWLVWGQIHYFWLFSASLAFFIFEKGQMKFVFFGQSDFLCQFGRF